VSEEALLGGQAVIESVMTRAAGADAVAIEALRAALGGETPARCEASPL